MTKHCGIFSLVVQILQGKSMVKAWEGYCCTESFQYEHSPSQLLFLFP